MSDEPERQGRIYAWHPTTGVIVFWPIYSISFLGLSWPGALDLLTYTPESRCVPIGEARSQKSQCGQGWFLLGTSEKDLFQTCLLAPATLLVLQLAEFSLHLFSLFSLYMCLSLFPNFPFFEYGSHIVQGPCPWPHFNLITSTKTLCPNRFTFWAVKG